MFFVKQSVSGIAEHVGNNNSKLNVELAARNCYKSEDKISDGTADKMVDSLIKSKHYAMLEHGTVYLVGKKGKMPMSIVNKYENNPYSRVFYLIDKRYLVITNLRVIQENDWYSDIESYGANFSDIINDDTLRQMVDENGRRSVMITTSIQVANELVRHRSFSFAQESTRWCNYTKGKFSNNLTFIEKDFGNKFLNFIYKASCKFVEIAYRFITKRTSAQMGASILPKCLKTSIVMTGFMDDWKKFIDIRFKESTGKVLPDMKEVASMINNILEYGLQ